MNGKRCPSCELVNLLTAETCHRCGKSLLDLPKTLEVSVPPEETFQAQGFAANVPNSIPQDNETGRKTHFWYRVYCSFLVALYVFVVVIGALVAFVAPPDRNSSAEENLIIGIIYMLVGAIFAIVFLVAVFLPRKPYNWIVGIVAIGLGMTSCCFLPACIPLLIFWLKPETQAYFGRNS